MIEFDCFCDFEETEDGIREVFDTPSVYFEKSLFDTTSGITYGYNPQSEDVYDPFHESEEDMVDVIDYFKSVDVSDTRDDERDIELQIDDSENFHLLLYIPHISPLRKDTPEIHILPVTFSVPHESINNVN